MSIFSKKRNLFVVDNFDKNLKNNIYLRAEKNSREKYQNLSTKEDSFINGNNNNNQLSQILELKSILDSKYYLIKKIGQGSYGKVYLAVHKDYLNYQDDNINYVCIKVMNAEKIDLNAFKTEIELLQKINHKNVLKIFAYGFGPKISLNKNKNKQPKEFYYIVEEYFKNYELSKYITDVAINENIGFGENLGRLIFSQLLDGLEAFHNLNIFHRDIKLNNIIIGNDFIMKYIDFGMGTEHSGLLHDYLGTPNYTSPELLLKQPYYGKSEDIFSLGVTLFILVTGKLPFKLALPNDSLYQYISRGDYVEFWKNKSSLNLSPSFMELIDNMIAFDFTQRPSISEIRQSTWMKEINWDLLPFLKQEFVLRKEKIKINEINKELLLHENKNLKSTNESNKSENINVIKESFMNDFNDVNKIKEECKILYRNKLESKLKIFPRRRNLQKHLINIKRYLKKEGYINFFQNIKALELKVTDGEVDIHIKLGKYKTKYIALNYYISKVTFQTSEKFKKILVNIRQIIEK